MMVRRVRNTEYVTHIIGRVKSVQAEEGVGAPDLHTLVHNTLPAHVAILTFTIGSVAVEKSHFSS